MQITKIQQNKNDSNRYSLFIDGQFKFSLSAAQLLKEKLAVGDELSSKRAAELKTISEQDKIYSSAIKYVTSRLKTKWEVDQYLAKKHASPALRQEILNKLSNANLVDDYNFALAYINDRQLTRPAPKLKITYELKKRHVNDTVIAKALDSSDFDELYALKELIVKKRDRYSDEVKLMRYLSSQGYKYADIKEALKQAT